MNTQPNMEERLWNYIDGNSAAGERDLIEQLLKTDLAWKEKYGELLEVNSLLKGGELDAPSLRFTKNVMEEIAKLHIAPATRSYINRKIIWGIGFFFIAMLLGILVYGFGQMTSSQGDPGAITKNLDKLDKLDFSKFFNNTYVNILMMVNVVLGLILLDHYLGMKKKKFQKEA